MGDYGVLPTYQIIPIDCRQAMRFCMANDSIDSIVTDPPYHLTSIVKRFGGSNAAPAKHGTDGAFARASTGFMGKSWDGGDVAFDPDTWREAYRVLKPGGHLLAFSGSRTYHLMACDIEDAGFEIRDSIMWLYGSGFPKSHDAGDGWGTALKPAHEPICLARKPFVGTVARNIDTWGTGAINIDGARIEGGTRSSYTGGMARKGTPVFGRFACAEVERITTDQGRFPANVIHDGLTEDWARFFYCAKASKADRDLGLEAFQQVETAAMQGNLVTAQPLGGDGSPIKVPMRANTHPTVKPTDLMRYLVRLVTPTGGTVLDPFTGSGSTGKAALLEGFSFIGCEMTDEYVPIAEARCAQALTQHQRAQSVHVVETDQSAVR